MVLIAMKNLVKEHKVGLSTHICRCFFVQSAFSFGIC